MSNSRQPVGLLLAITKAVIAFTSGWKTKPKIRQEQQEGRILTPDGQTILVGSTQDEVLLYQEEESTWTEKNKTIL